MTTETTATANTFKDIKVWKNATRTESRIYVHMADGREGCRYLTGNGYHAPKSVDGNLTEAEWKEARRLAYDGASWNTMYFTPAPWEKNETSSTGRGGHTHHNSERCPDCGNIGTCGGGNCTSNRF